MRRRRRETWCRGVVLTISFLIANSPSLSAMTPSDVPSVFYPLGIGDHWEYVEYASFGGGIVDTTLITVIGDSAIGTQAYRVVLYEVPHYSVRTIFLERCDSLGDAYRYFNGTEEFQYHFSDTSATPWEVADGLRRWDRNFVDSTFNPPRHVLVALDYHPWDTLGIFGSGTFFVEGIGMTGTRWSEGGGLFFRGARISGVLYGTITSVATPVQGIEPHDYVVRQNYPNPFNPSTTIWFSVSHPGWTTIAIVDVMGREVVTVVNEWKPQGTFGVTWNASNFASGVYFCRFRSGRFSQTIKMTLLK